jgi:histidyl-tRNA synthetase
MTNEDTVKGFQDFIGEEAEKRAVIREVLRQSFERYGFSPAETPIVENEEFVKGENSNDEAVSDIFRLQDKGKRKLALRYELTFPLKRIMRNQKLPFKRYQIGEVFRDEPTTGNRFRQFTQCDIDVIGSDSRNEAEILALVKDVLSALKINFVIYFNNRKLLNEILEKEKVSEGIRKEVIRIIDKLDKKSEKEVRAELKEFGAENILTIIKNKEKCKNYESYSGIKFLEEYCKIYGIKAEFLPSLARGLSYYNGSVFEIKTKEMKESIGAGGSYMFNGIQSTGISFGLERLSALANLKLQLEKYLVVSLGEDKKTIEIARKLRKNGKIVSIFYGKPSKALDYANSYKINNVIFVGEKEVKKKIFKIKIMSTGKEIALKL